MSQKNEALLAAMAGGHVVQPSVYYDGHHWGATAVGALHLIYLARLARDGDVHAKGIMDAFGVTIEDIKERQYYPPLEVISPEVPPA